MPNESVAALKQQWQALVQEHFARRRQAERLGASQAELLDIDAAYEFRIDLAYSEVKIAESLETLQATLKRARSVRRRIR